MCKDFSITFICKYRASAAFPYMPKLAGMCRKIMERMGCHHLYTKKSTQIQWEKLNQPIYELANGKNCYPLIPGHWFNLILRIVSVTSVPAFFLANFSQSANLMDVIDGRARYSDLFRHELCLWFAQEESLEINKPWGWEKRLPQKNSLNKKNWMGSSKREKQKNTRINEGKRKEGKVKEKTYLWVRERGRERGQFGEIDWKREREIVREGEL